MSQPELIPFHPTVGDQVIVEWAELRERGIVQEHNDPDQGDFEFYVKTKSGGSYWPRECLTYLRPAE